MARTAQPDHIPIVHYVHVLYGAALTVFGSVQFVYPQLVSEKVFGIPCEHYPEHSAVICQTVGLILSVTGFYSLYAFTVNWPSGYFLLTAPPKIIIGVWLLVLVQVDTLPWVFVWLASMELVVGVFTLLRTLPDAKSALAVRPFDILTAAQLSHALASGLFAMALSVYPSAVLPGLLGSTQPIDLSTKVWGHLMGICEFTMTWNYSLSGVFVEVERFAMLSVYTRLGALVTLWCSAAAGLCTWRQAFGCTPDGVLALFTLYAWRAVRSRRRTMKQT